MVSKVVFPSSTFKHLSSRFHAQIKEKTPFYCIDMLLHQMPFSHLHDVHYMGHVFNQCSFLPFIVL